MRSPGLAIAGAIIVVLNLWIVSMVVHWVPLVLLVLGAIALIVGLLPPDAALGDRPAAGGDQSLRARLHELDELLADGLVSHDEHAAKRAQLIERWGR